MTESPKPDGKRPAIQVVGTTLLRVLSWAAGLAFILIGTVLPLLFIANELQEAQSAPQWGGDPIFISVAGVAAGLSFAAVCGFAAFRLIRFAIRGPNSS